MTQEQELRVGIVGCGKIADGHAEVLKFLPGAKLVAVCDREILLAEQLAVRFGLTHWYDDLSAMLATENLDVVHITTPPAVHLALTRQCVEAGVHVFLEKPLTLTAPESAELIRTVEENGRKMSINYWPNFDPPAMEFKQLLAQGVIGDVVHVEAFIGYDLSGAYGQALLGDPSHWVNRLPGKLFQNMMDHIFNRIVPLFPAGPPEVHAFAYKRRAAVMGNATDEVLDELRVVMKSGTVSAYGTLCSHARPVANRLTVYGTKNTIEIDFNQRTVIVEKWQNYPSAIGRLIPPFEMAKQYLTAGRNNIIAFRKNEFQFFAGMSTLLELFYASVRTDSPLPISYEEILSVARVMDDVISQVYPPKGGAA